MDIKQRLSAEIAEKNYYNYLMKIKTELRKNIKKQNFDEFSKTLIASFEFLVENNEKESIKDLIKFFMEESDKFSSKITDKSLILTTFVSILNEVKPSKVDLSVHIYTFLQTLEKLEYPKSELISKKVYSTVSDYFSCTNDIIKAYKYSVLTEDHNFINSKLKLIFNETKELTETDKEYFISRSGLELIALGNIDESIKLVQLNLSQTKTDNHPILNFTHSLGNLLKKYSNFDNFFYLINKYKPYINIDKNLDKVIDRISTIHYQRSIFKENKGDIMGALKGLLNAAKN